MENTERAPAPQGTAPNRWIADIRKNSRETLRVELTSYKGNELVSLRVFYDAGGGETRPGKAGVALRVEKLADLQAAIAKAIDAARAEGHL